MFGLRLALENQRKMEPFHHTVRKSWSVRLVSSHLAGQPRFSRRAKLALSVTTLTRLLKYHDDDELGLTEGR